MTELWAHALTWAEVDPLRHPFELDEDAAKELAGRVAPLLPDADAAEEKRWRSLDPVTEFWWTGTAGGPAGGTGRWVKATQTEGSSARGAAPPIP
ncbi:hypothetical protein [Streptomyces mirabilis]|uniref:hypothetical protein n=1 Tax=Streptomyces mirabilis TaxID=68239 RepID=UPI0036B2B575